MVINDVGIVFEEVAAVAKLAGGLSDCGLQAGRRVRLAGDSQVLVANHIEQEKSANSRHEALLVEFPREMRTAVEPVAVIKSLNGFFQIRPDEPYLHLGLLVRERVGERKDDGG